MSDAAFYYIGMGVVFTITGAAVVAALLAFYALCLHGRFNLILFRRGQRRLSLASWYNARLMSDPHFAADDWPIGPRPFYVSYRLSKHRYFIMLGSLPDTPRRSVITGRHPEEDWNADPSKFV